MATVSVCRADQLKDGESRKFGFKRDGVSFEGFVVRVGGNLFVYENRCRHLPLPLDCGDGQFFAPDGQHLVCSSHGAMYDPATGACVQGPCAGAALKRLPFSVDGGKLLVAIEETDGNPE